MKAQLIIVSTLLMVAPALLQSCASPTEPTAETDATTETAETEMADPETAEAPAAETGMLEIRANGEDFVRQGFVSKDGWEISFDHVYVTLAEVTAYQSDPPFDAEAGGQPQATTTVMLDEVKTVDLAEGDENADTIKLGEVEAPTGHFNALSWRMVSSETGPAAGYPLVLQGTATKDGQTVNFTLQIDQELAFTCGDFVGDERKGIVSAGETADLEATFHFDHLFGDAGAPMDDDLNMGALGFDPLAAIAENGELTADVATLQEQLSEEDFNKLLNILPSLGHVGEGHCEEEVLTTS
jgi:hypothetical protein